MPRSQTIPGIELGVETGPNGKFVWRTNSLGNRRTIAGDHGNYGYPHFPPNRNIGGTFVQENTVITLDPIDVGEIAAKAWNQVYNGSISASAYPPIGSVSTGDASSRGAEAYNRMKPDKPSFSGLNSLYELREVPEMLVQRFTPDLKGASNYWLALQFGWKPLLNDIRNLVNSQRNLQKRLRWLLDHEGQPVRRSVRLVDTSSTQQTFGGYALSALQPQLVTGYYASEPKYGGSHQSGEEWWASARFRFWLPDGPRDIAWRRKVLAYLYGLYPTPRVIYNMIPWSWLVDWFTNAGDVLSNLQADVASRLAADHFYCMRRNWARCEFNAQGTFNTSSGFPTSVNSTSRYEVEHLSRVMGDPFGFATNQNMLSGMQLSILGALGISRL